MSTHNDIRHSIIHESSRFLAILCWFPREFILGVAFILTRSFVMRGTFAEYWIPMFSANLFDSRVTHCSLRTLMLDLWVEFHQGNGDGGVIIDWFSLVSSHLVPHHLDPQPHNQIATPINLISYNNRLGKFYYYFLGYF